MFRRLRNACRCPRRGRRACVGGVLRVTRRVREGAARVSGFAGLRWVLPAVPAFAMVCALVVRALSMVDGRQV